MAPGWNATTAPYCFLDVDLDHHRAQLATAAAFVDATDSRYGFSSKDLRLLGGSELSRIHELIATDHEWSTKGSIQIRPPPSGTRIVIQLYWKIAPLACENFATLCANGVSPGLDTKKTKAPLGECGKPLTYRNSQVHRVVPGFIVQGGDFVFGNGSGGESIFAGKKFKDERPGLQLKHDRRGLLSMGNSGKNSNTSQWFFTLNPAPQCDGKHVIFGEMVSGGAVLDAMEQMGSNGSEPPGTIEITDCGVWQPLKTPGSGYWYDQPDAEAFTGVSSMFMVRPRVAVLAPNETVGAKFDGVLQAHCSVTRIVTTEKEAEQEESLGTTAAAWEQIHNLLQRFQVDVVVLAPACSKLLNDSSVQLPPAWSNAGIVVEQVLLVTKPVDALRAVHRQSWLAQTSWPLQGNTAA